MRKIILTILLFTLPLVCFAQDAATQPSAANQEIVIATDKTSYEQRESVKVTIKNNTAGEKIYWSPFYIVERLDKGNWLGVRKILHRCEVSVAQAGIISVEPHRIIEYEWNQKEEWCHDNWWGESKTISKQVPPGRYRVKVVASNPRTGEGRQAYYPDNRPYYSNEFIIK